MAKIREDLVGVIHVPGGVVLKAGDTVPTGVVVHESRLARAARSKPAAKPTEDAPEPEKPAPKRRTRKKAVSEDAGDVD